METSNATGIVHHLDHFVLPVMDPNRAEKFYVEVLGGRTLRKMSDPSVTRIFIKVGQNHIGLFSQNKALSRNRKRWILFRATVLWLPGATSTK